MICHYWLFNHGFNYVYNKCHNLRILFLNISDISIVTVKDVDYRFIIHDINKSEVINFLENSLLENRGYM